MLIDITKIHFDPEIRGVIHVGANTAEEQPIYDKLGVKKVLYIDARKESIDIIERKYRDNPDIIALHYVISDKCEWHDFNISSNAGASSSLLKLGTHKKHHPKIDMVKTEMALTTTLNIVFETPILHIEDYNFINLDIQGTELRALKGFGDNIKCMDYIYTEINIEEVYEGCDQLNELEDYIFKFGFRRLEMNLTKFNWGDALYYKSK